MKSTRLQPLPEPASSREERLGNVRVSHYKADKTIREILNASGIREDWSN